MGEFWTRRPRPGPAVMVPSPTLSGGIRQSFKTSKLRASHVCAPSLSSRLVSFCIQLRTPKLLLLQEAQCWHSGVKRDVKRRLKNPHCILVFHKGSRGEIARAPPPPGTSYSPFHSA